MAFSFDNLINKIKQQFKPKTYLNVDTGEVINKRIYKTLDETEKSSYIPTDKFEETTGRLPKSNTTVDEPKGKQIAKPKVSKIFEKSKSKFVRLKRKSDYIKDEDRWKSEKENTKKVKEKRSKNKYKNIIKKAEKTLSELDKQKKNKTYEDVKPPAPPKEVTKELEKNMEKPLPIIDSIQALKKELAELERKVYPIYDLSGTRSYLLGIVEDMEAYYEGTSDYANYLKENEEEIADKLWIIQYESKDQEKIDTAITQLATLLNMGTLSPLQQDDLDYVHNNYGWDDNNG